MKIDNPVSNPYKENKRLKQQLNAFLQSEDIFESHPAYPIQRFVFDSSTILRCLKNAGSLQIKEKYMLGKRVEKFFSFYLQNTDHLKIIRESLQIRNGKDTVGELDYLLRDISDEQSYHIELVYKFYLYDPEINDNEIGNWIGPNRNDALSIKLNKLFQHQFPLLQSEYTKSYLEKLKIEVEQIRQKLCFKAQLFIPKNYRKNTLSEINLSAIKGYWIHSGDFRKEDYADHQFYIPEKQDWIIDPRHGQNWYGFDEIYEVVRSWLDSKKSPLVWSRKKGNEYKKFFIVWW